MPKCLRHVSSAIISLSLAIGFITVTAATTVRAEPALSSTASGQDKAKACNDTADRRNLKGDDREKFMRSCLNKAADSGSNSNASQQDKSRVCNDLADKKNLTGSDRRSFVKDCMKRANP
jgi:psiF repeat